MTSSATPPPGPPPPPPPPPPSHSNRWDLSRLRRSTNDRMLGGVAGGIAQSFGIDPTLVRIAFVVTAFFGAAGLIIYAVCWVLVPEDTDTRRQMFHPYVAQRDIGPLVGVVLVGLGVLLLIDRLLPGNPPFFAFTWPLLLIGGGLAILVLRARRDPDDLPVGWTPPERVATPGGPVAPDAGGFPFTTATSIDTPRPSPYAATTGATATADGTDTPGDTVTADGGEGDAATADADQSESVTATAGGPGWPPTSTSTAWAQTQPWPTGWSTPPPHRPRKPRPRPFLGPICFSVLLIVGGTAALLNALDVITVEPETIGALGLLIIGGTLVVAAWVGRARGLIFLGLLLIAFTSVMSLLDVPFRGGFGERVYRPLTEAEVKQDGYELAAGHMQLDLRDLDVNGTVPVEATLAMGRLEVLVPDDVRVRVHAEADAGNVDVFGHETGGSDLDVDETNRHASTDVIDLDVRVGFGRVDVSQYDTSGLEIFEGDQR